MPVGDLLPEIAVVVAAVLTLLFASFAPRGWQPLGAVLAAFGLAVAAAFCWRQLGDARFTFHGTWAIDGAATWARLMILAATAFTLLLTPAWLRSDARHGEYYAMLLLAALGAMVLAAAADLLLVVVGVLLSSVTGYTLAAWHRDWPLSVEAGMKYFLVGALANALLAIGVTLVFGVTAASGFEAMAVALAPDAASPLLLLGVALVVVGLAFKLGAVPAHAWMPDVAEGAPAPAAAFLTVVPKIGAAIVLLRFVSLFPPDAVAIRPVLAAISLATMTLGNLAALWQDDVRRLIGWSSVSQSGYALMAVVVVGLSAEALPALLVFLLGYTIANLAAFAVVVHLRGRTGRGDYVGLGATRPLAALALALAFLSLVGIPPLAGFVGKLGLFVAAVDGGYSWLAAAAVANTVLSLVYYLRVIGPMVFDRDARRPAILGRGSHAAVALAAALVIGIGLAAEPFWGGFSMARLIPLVPAVAP